MGGSGVTVGVASSYNGEIGFAAPWRTVIDMAKPLQAYSVLGPGQSGQFLSPWYLDQVDDWTTGKYHVTSINPNEYQAAGYHLMLVPAS
jgi:penicillin amidase